MVTFRPKFLGSTLIDPFHAFLGRTGILLLLLTVYARFPFPDENAPEGLLGGRQLMPSHTQDRTRIRESRTYGLGGALSNEHPYRNLAFVAMHLVRCWQIAAVPACPR